MSRFLLVVIISIVAALGYLSVRYAKESYKLLPMNDMQENQLENRLVEEPDYENWEMFTSPAGDFQVLMPSKPQHVSDKSSDPKTKMERVDNVYLAEKKNGTVFMIHMISYPSMKEAEAAEDELLHNFMEDMLASNPANKLAASLPALYKGEKSLDFVIENETFSYNVREFVHGKTLIVLASISRKPFQDIKDFEFFINSFEFTSADHQKNK